MFALYLKEILQLIMSPEHGWEDISYDSPDLKKLLVKAFVPWLIIVSLSVIISSFYAHSFEWVAMIFSILATFLKYFITYYIAGFAFSVFMPTFTEGAGSEKLCNSLIIYSLGLLALINLIDNCLPVSLPLLGFFPFYVIFIMFRGMRYCKVAKGRGWPFTFLCAASVVAPPWLLNLFFNLIIS